MKFSISQTFSITDTAIDSSAARKAVADNSCGALVVFEGWIRDHNEGQQVARLEYEVYRPVAEKEGARIIAEALQRYAVSHALCIHREGLLELGEIAVIVCVSSPHRGAAFDACRYIIDQTKTRLPIWKKEHYVSGTSEWVNCEQCASAGHSHIHPGDQSGDPSGDHPGEQSGNHSSDHSSDHSGNHSGGDKRHG